MFATAVAAIDATDSLDGRVLRFVAIAWNILAVTDCAGQSKPVATLGLDIDMRDENFISAQLIRC